MNEAAENGEGQSISQETSLEKALAEEREKASRYLASWQRAQADYLNFKRRSEHEMEDAVRFGNTMLLLSLLPLLDDIERALGSVPARLAENDWVEGIRMIARKLKTTLEAQGLEPIKALGEPFDPNLHEAVRQADGADGIVIEEVQKGYRFRDRVIRPSKVVVGNGEGTADKEES